MMGAMKKLILASLLFSPSLYSAEADNFTARKLVVEDVREEVNALANTYLEKAIKSLSHSSNCDQNALYTELRKYFANHSKGELVKEILYKETIAKYSLPLKESVYGEWSVPNGFLLGRKKAALSPLALSPLIRIGEHNIGVDKLEHMFGMGFSYFTKHHLNNKSIDSVLSRGVLAEKTILGGNIIATGVFSYADLSANFNGMRFWNHILLKNNDILGADFNRGPFVKCEENKWIVNTEKSIDFADYVDASFDESLNCSKFASKKGAKKFNKAIKDLGFSGCPVDASRIPEMKKKYEAHKINKFIINDEGLGTVSYINEI